MIKGEVLGGPELVAKVEGKYPNFFKEQIGRAVLRLTLLLQARVKTKLSGEVLNVKTGRLRRSISRKIEGEGTPVVTGSVGTNVKYAPPHEFGFHDKVTIKQHMRMQTMAWGRPMEPRQVTVSSHTAAMNLPERSFLRSSLQELEPAIRAEIAKAAKIPK